MVLFCLSITGVAVEVLVQSQLDRAGGGVLFWKVRCQTILPVALSSAASVFEAASVKVRLFVPWLVFTFSTTRGAVNMEAPDSMSRGTSLSIWVFHLSSIPPTFFREMAVSFRFH